MVYGTMISNAIVLGTIVSVSAMLSGSGPQARAVRLRPRLGRSQDLAVHPCLQGQGALPAPPSEPLREVNALLMGLVLHVDRGACCKACTVRCLFRKKSAVYHPYFLNQYFRITNPLHSLLH